MVKIQINLSDKEDKIVEIYKIVNNLKTKEEAIKNMVNYFEVNITPKKIEKQEYYNKMLKSLGGK
jgi:hypothetical protein